MAKVAVVIPARYGSTRFPGKPLALIKGKPLVQRVLERIKQCKNINLAAVATDDQRIYDAVKGLGFEVFMTPETCKSGTDRIAFVAQKYLLDCDIFINVQGDEPLIDPALVDALASELLKNDSLECITAAFPISRKEDIENPNIVKVVFDQNGYALYFSRSPIPYNRDNGAHEYFKHIGIYGYKRDFVINFAKSPSTALEKAESLEQLRALEAGKKIKVIKALKDSIGVDSPSDIAKVERQIKI